MNGKENTYISNVAIFTSEKTDFKTQAKPRDKAAHYIIIKRSIQQEDIALVNIYAPNIGVPKYIKQILMDINKETDSNSYTYIYKHSYIYTHTNM